MSNFKKIERGFSFATNNDRVLPIEEMLDDKYCSYMAQCLGLMCLSLGIEDAFKCRPQTREIEVDGVMQDATFLNPYLTKDGLLKIAELTGMTEFLKLED